MTFTLRKVGAPHTLEHRVYIEKDGIPVSPFHDIPLYANQEQTVLNMVIEIPRWTNAKLEVSVYRCRCPCPAAQWQRNGPAEVQAAVRQVVPGDTTANLAASRSPRRSS